jgi:hypothetical protein
MSFGTWPYTRRSFPCYVAPFSVMPRELFDFSDGGVFMRQYQDFELDPVPASSLISAFVVCLIVVSRSCHTRTRFSHMLAFFMLMSNVSHPVVIMAARIVTFAEAYVIAHVHVWPQSFEPETGKLAILSWDGLM